MTPAETKLKRCEYLQEVLWKYLNTEPAITMEELAYVICDQLCDKDLLKFIKKYKKEVEE
jgi:hypothetical protein